MAFHSFYSEIQIFFHGQWNMINPFCVLSPPGLPWPLYFLSFSESLHVLFSVCNFLSSIHVNVSFLSFSILFNCYLLQVAFPVILTKDSPPIPAVTVYKSYQPN